MRHRPLLLLALASIAGPAAADAQVFTDRASFEAALGGAVREPFEAASLVGTTGTGAQPSLSFPDFTVATAPNAAKVIDVPYYGAANTTPGGKNYLYLDTDIGGQGSISTFTPAASVFGVGFDYTGLQTGVTVTVQGQTFPLPDTSSASARFWGFVSSAPISSFVVNSGTDSGYGIDEMTFGQPCGAPSFAYGQGCPGSGGFVPVLAGEPCAEVGQPYTLTVSNGLGGATAVFFLGLAAGDVSLGGGCSYLLSPIFPPLFALPLGGAGAGNGQTILPQVVPANAPLGAVVTLQVLIQEPTLPAGLSASNGWRITIG